MWRAISFQEGLKMKEYSKFIPFISFSYEINLDEAGGKYKDRYWATW